MPKKRMLTGELLNWLYGRKMSRGDIISFGAWIKENMPPGIYARRGFCGNGTKWNVIHLSWITGNIEQWEESRGIPKEDRVSENIRVTS